MNNLTKIILIVFVAFLLLNYSCGNKENFAKRRKKNVIKNVLKE